MTGDTVETVVTALERHPGWALVAIVTVYFLVQIAAAIRFDGRAPRRRR